MTINADRDLLNRCQQNSLEQNKSLRTDSELASKIFGIVFDKELLEDYYFWDNTTVSMKSPLIDFTRKGMRILEIGTGPSATLSRFLAKNVDGLEITSSDINEKFLKSSSQYETSTYKSSIKFVHSNLFNDINDTFDLVFMNPPYVSAKDLRSMGIMDSTSEYLAGFGGENGSEIVLSFLRQSVNFIRDTSVVVLGINNRYLSDLMVLELIDCSNLKLVKKYYKQSESPPFSQCYILSLI